MAPLPVSSDLDALLSEAGEQVVLGTDTTFGTVRRPSALELEAAGAAGLIARQVVVTVRTGSLPGLVTGATISVGSASYLVREWLATDHGALTQIYCIEPA